MAFITNILNDLEIAGVITAAVGTAALVATAAEVYSLSGSTNATDYTNSQTTVYPTDLLSSSSANNDFCMKFDFYQYQRPTIFSNVFTKPFGTIVLPIPTNIVDHQSIGYVDSDPTNPALGAALDGMVGSYRNNQANWMASAVESLGPALYGAGTAGAVGGATNILNTLGKTVGLGNAANRIFQTSGLAVNPYLTVLFTAPTFKRHTFIWKFMPNNLQESNTIKYIINKFKYHQLPDTNQATAGSLLQYPDVVRPTIIPQGYVYSFKHCVIQDSIANYAPGTTPSFVGSSNAPSAIEFTIQLLEIEYFLKRDMVNTTDPNFLPPTSETTTTIIPPSANG